LGEEKYIKYYSESRSVLSVSAANRMTETLLLKIPVIPGLNIIILPEVSAPYDKLKLKDGRKSFILALPFRKE
jgi:hypothetical protein